jgi:ATPase subunit of ABC transporter with duplicated ATPase domains
VLRPAIARELDRTAQESWDDYLVTARRGNDGTTALDLGNVSKSYGARKAVDGVSLTLRSGECLGLLGPNGAGKTTTILLTCGLLAPDSGTVAIGADRLPPTQFGEVGSGQSHFLAGASPVSQETRTISQQPGTITQRNQERGQPSTVSAESRWHWADSRHRAYRRA